MNSILFPTRYPVNSYTNLPLTLMTLDDWVIINVVGPDSEKYLQSQLTVNVFQMNDDQHLLAAHCDLKGKMWSVLHLFRSNNGFSFIERRSLYTAQMTELKKYSIFSKVELEKDDKMVLLGIAGFQARTVLTNLFNKLPTEEQQIIRNDNIIFLWFKYPKERFLLITDTYGAKHIIKELYSLAQFNNSKQWLVLNIEAGIPIIDVENSRKFTPQATNLQELGGINFRKGCYIGQEAIAREKFRGANKRAMFFLSGYTNRVPVAGEDLELKIGNNWRLAGTVLAAVQIDDGRLLVQAVANKNIQSNSIFRVRNNINDDILHIEPLPYLLEKS